MIEELTIPAPELRGASFLLGACRDKEVCLDGPAGSSKTFSILYKVHMLLLLHPGAKALIARKSMTALAGSAIASFRTAILQPSEGVHYFGGNRIRPAAFEYPNGSVLIVNGLDKREKIMSWEFDIAYINEATECDVEDIEYVRIRLRNGKIGYHQLIMDCNPAHPTHWLNQRMNEGTTTRLISRHEDNPRFFTLAENPTEDHKGDWTEAGKEYIFDTLEKLTGVRYARYRLGIWAAAEGTVYEDSWDRARNVVDPFPIPKDWPRYLAIDFGYTHPFCCLWAATDPDGRIYIYRQIYRTKRLVEDHAKDIAIASGWFHLLPKNHQKYNARASDNADPLPRSIICDHDAEDRATLERHLGLYTTPAKKTVSDGIQAVASRMRPAGDGKPRLMVMRNSLYERDEELAQAKRPTCLEEEPESYVYQRNSSGTKEEPVKENDHALDPLRYLIADTDLNEKTVTYFKNIWR